MRRSNIGGSLGMPLRRSLHAGAALAVVVAMISGFSVFINGYGVAAWSGTADPTTYTTFKNLVAAGVLIGVATLASARRSAGRVIAPIGVRQWLGLTVVAVLGGALAFALFFEGLARATSTQSAFIHKTLVLWVGILAVGILRERVRALHVAAIALLIVGQFVLIGGIGEVSFGVGELLVLAATLLWSIEIIVAKRLLAEMTPLTVGVARMAGGAVVLTAYGIASGGFAAVGAVHTSQIGWVVVTGAALAAYVGVWYAALAMAPAIDVTAILVGGAVITAVLRSVVTGAPLGSPLGLALIIVGTSAAILAARRASDRRPLAVEPR
jgi:drug/metabolite transporter (DMT)-like permease